VATQKIGQLLAAGQLKTLSREAQRLAELQQVLFDAAPHALTEATRVKLLRAGTLVLLADNTAIAAKLRQLIPRLLVCVRKREPEVNGIRVEVQPGPLQERSREKPRGRRLSTDAIRNFENLAKRLPSSPLQASVVRLVQHHKSGKR
jgi:hypothetical protein